MKNIMMKDSLLHTPEGVRAIYGEEFRKKEWIEEKLHDVLKRHCFQDIQTPTFEFFDIFNHEKGSAISKDMYKFFDRDNNTLVLRPDMTPSIARCVSKYFSQKDMPLRLGYCENTFINSPKYQGKLKETTNLGAELFGDDTSIADAEMIATIIEGFLAIGLKEFQISVGHVGFFKGLIEQAKLDSNTELEFKEFINTKNFFGLEQKITQIDLKDNIAQAFISIDELNGGIEVIESAKKYADNKVSKEALERLEKVNQALQYFGYEKYVSYDLGMLSRYDYYTGVIVKGYTYGIGDAVVRGGRYNNLMKQFGEDIPAIGFSFVVDDVLAAMNRQKLDIKTDFQASMCLYERANQQQAVKFASECRNKGENIALTRKSSKKSMKEYLQCAKMNHYSRVFYFEHADKISIYDVETGEEQKAEYKDFI